MQGNLPELIYLLRVSSFFKTHKLPVFVIDALVSVQTLIAQDN
jgi:hypothetical protein